MSGKAKIHVARNGKMLGIYDPEAIGDLIDTGSLLPDDHFFDDESGEWRPLSERKTSSQHEYRPAASASMEGGAPESSRRSRRESRSRQKSRARIAVAASISALVILIIAVALWSYANSLQGKLGAAEDRVKELSETAENLRRENQLLTEITPAGHVRGVIAYSPTPDQVAIMSGATVGLYRRDDIATALTQAKSQADLANPGTFDQSIDVLKNLIKSPLSITLSDSNGRVDLTLPGPGDYVLVASAAKATKTGQDRYLWLIGVRFSDRPSGLILLNEQNAISQDKPAFEIKDVPGYQTP